MRLLLTLIVILFSFPSYSAIETVIKSRTQTVATAGTPEALVPTTEKVYWVVIKATSGNTGNVMIGNSDSQDIAFSSDQTIRLDAAVLNGDRKKFDLNKIYVDSDVDGEGVQFIYSQVKAN